VVAVLSLNRVASYIDLVIVNVVARRANVSIQLGSQVDPFLLCAKVEWGCLSGLEVR